MDPLKKWMIIRFTPNQTTTLPKKDVLPNFFLLQIILAATVNGKCGIQVYIPPNNSDDHCFLLSLYPSSMNCSTVFGPNPVIQRKNWFMNQWMRKFYILSIIYPKKMTADDTPSSWDSRFKNLLPVHEHAKQSAHNLFRCACKQEVVHNLKIRVVDPDLDIKNQIRFWHAELNNSNVIAIFTHKKRAQFKLKMLQIFWEKLNLCSL